MKIIKIRLDPLYGRACANVVELPMNVIRSHLVQWKRTIKKLAEHFNVCQTSIKARLRELEHEGGKMKRS